MNEYRATLSYAGGHNFITILPGRGYRSAADAYYKTLGSTGGQQLAETFEAPNLAAIGTWVAQKLKSAEKTTEVFVWNSDIAEAVKVKAFDADEVRALVEGDAAHGEGITVDEFRAKVADAESAIAKSACETMEQVRPNVPVEWSAPADATVDACIADEKERNEEFDDLKHDKVDKPSHYDAGGFECIDVLKASLSHEEFCGFLRGNVVKYHFRALKKGGLEDVFKAGWYQRRLEKELAEDRDGDK